MPRIEGEGKKRHPESFEVYAPVAFGSINGINPVTADRSITIHMARGTDIAVINRSVDPRDPIFGAIRASLYRGALLWGPWMRERQRGLEDLVPPFVTGRHRELVLPLLVIAELAGGSPFRDDLLLVSGPTLSEHESLPDEGRGLFYALEGRLAKQMGLGDLRATQTLLGHADPRMTMRYAHLSDTRLREAVRSLDHLQTGATPSAISDASAKK